MSISISKNPVFRLILATIAVLAAVAVFGRWGNRAEAGKYDAFAQCLAAKGIIIYGADWCPHCQNEKKAFGSSFKYITYVECPDEPQKCIAAGINGYPTWVFPDGRRLEGEQGIEKLSQESGCALTQQPAISY